MPKKKKNCKSGAGWNTAVLHLVLKGEENEALE